MMHNGSSASFQRWLAPAALLMGLLGLLNGSLRAAEPTPSATNKNPAVIATRTISVRPVCPVDYFRELLAMSPAQRQISMAGQSPEQKRALLAKIKEYESMPVDMRELRLRQTELHWYLLDLMKALPGQRPARLTYVPPQHRGFLAEQLHQWDKLSPEWQKLFLENQSAIELWLRLQAISPAQQKSLIESYPADRRKKIEDELARWQTIPAGQRQSMIETFHQFFEQPDSQQLRTLSVLSEKERKEMEAALQAFSFLSPDQRRRCIESFGKFANMPVEQRREFFRNAARWQAMSPSERKLWRDLVHKLPVAPPLPPGLDLNSPPLPPGWNSSGLPPSPLLALTNSSPVNRINSRESNASPATN